MQFTTNLRLVGQPAIVMSHKSILSARPLTPTEILELSLRTAQEIRDTATVKLLQGYLVKVRSTAFGSTRLSVGTHFWSSSLGFETREVNSVVA